MPNLPKPDLSLIKGETLITKIAETKEEVEQAQHLRYVVFYEELHAVADEEMAKTKRDFDRFDEFCDHLLVIDTTLPKNNNVVGTYRILSKETANKHNISLYTETEFDLSKLIATGANIMEVSRSCVLEPYRSGTIINLLWAGLAAYAFHYNVDYLLGIPSFHGTDISTYKDELAYLKAFHAADEHISPTTIASVPFNPLPTMDIDAAQKREIFKKLPPLLKGYIRLGGVIGNSIFVDEQFNTTDVCILVKTSDTKNKYITHYKRMLGLE